MCTRTPPPKHIAGEGRGEGGCPGRPELTPHRLGPPRAGQRGDPALLSASPGVRCERRAITHGPPQCQLAGVGDRARTTLQGQGCGSRATRSRPFSWAVNKLGRGMGRVLLWRCGMQEGPWRRRQRRCAAGLWHPSLELRRVPRSALRVCHLLG